jgi:hypothetical protein
MMGAYRVQTELTTLRSQQASRATSPPWLRLGQDCGESVTHSWSSLCLRQRLCRRLSPGVAVQPLATIGVPATAWRSIGAWGLGRRKGTTRQGSNRERGRDAGANWVLTRGCLFVRNPDRWIPLLGLHRALIVLGLYGSTDSSVCTRSAPYYDLLASYTK